MIPYDVARCINADCKRALECARFMDPLGPASPVMEDGCADGEMFISRGREMASKFEAVDKTILEAVKFSALQFSSIHMIAERAHPGIYAMRRYPHRLTDQRLQSLRKRGLAHFRYGAWRLGSHP